MSLKKKPKRRKKRRCTWPVSTSLGSSKCLTNIFVQFNSACWMIVEWPRVIESLFVIGSCDTFRHLALNTFVTTKWLSPAHEDMRWGQRPRDKCIITVSSEFFKAIFNLNNKAQAHVSLIPLIPNECDRNRCRQRCTNYTWLHVKSQWCFQWPASQRA